MHFFIFRVTTPSADSGNPSESSPMKPEPEVGQEPEIEIEHVDNFETDLSTITQKIAALSKTFFYPVLYCKIIFIQLIYCIQGEQFWK